MKFAYRLPRLGVALAAGLLLAAPAMADALIDNMDGMTLDKDGKVVRFRAMLIANGKVTRLLERGDKPPARVDWRVDLGGRTVLPGFVDGHGHVLGLGFRAVSLDLGGTRSLAEALERIRAHAAANPDARWIRGGGWNQEAWALGRFPTAAELDAAVPDRPVWLARADGHAGWANSAALKAAGITARTPAPAGGAIEKGAGGAPAGVLVDNAMALVDKAAPAPLPLEYDVALRKAQDLLLAQGVTAVADMGTAMDDWLAMRRFGDVGGLRIRIMSYAAGVDVASRVAGPGPTPWLYGDRLRMGGVKLLADGALGSRGALLKADYADAPGQRGLRILNDAQLKNLMSHAAMNNMQVAVHAIGDGANREALDAIEAMSDTYKGDRRWRIEHAQVVDPADLPRFARFGTIASMQPVHQTGDARMAEARLGAPGTPGGARLAGAYAWASMLRAGSRLAFGTDFPVESADPWAGWAAAFTRQGADGEPFGGWQPQERVTREQAWKAYTVDAAYAGFAEDRFGRLAPGLAADFIVIDKGDPLLLSPTELRATKVLQTWVAGEKVYERKGDANAPAGR